MSERKRINKRDALSTGVAYKKGAFFFGLVFVAVGDVTFTPNRFANIVFTLRFVEEVFEQRGSGRNRSRQLVTYEHYSEEKRVNTSTSSPGASVKFDVPDNPQWVNNMRETPMFYWELMVEAEVPGIDFKTTFPLPVYARP